MNRIRWNRWIDKFFNVVGIGATSFGILVLLVLLVDVLVDGFPRLSWDFLTSYPSRKPEQAGILSAWIGTIWIMLTTGLFAIPIGIGAGIYLAKASRYL